MAVLVVWLVARIVEDFVWASGHFQWKARLALGPNQPLLRDVAVDLLNWAGPQVSLEAEEEEEG